ncbi:uncharacterized protein LOC100198707 [Hydra vulgaris]|uniref:uncharacterized protein LOC100198707 n=1 Tax=Hydra vulgaris TaxID=6087 RepID=UPI00019264D9|nr:sphingolipid C9-methyltransferase [Hydra vulgaris]XP_047128257.1 sphingolipid C9-methyltransferase [Hydra vulgaris]
MAPSSAKTVDSIVSNGNGVMHKLNGNANGKQNGFSKSICLPDEKTWEKVTFKKLLFFNTVASFMICYYLNFPFYILPVTFLITFVPVFASFLGVCNFLYHLFQEKKESSKVDHYVEFVDEAAKAKHSGKYIPIRDLYELYADGKINFKLDLLQCLERRHEYVVYKLQWWHLKFFLCKFVPEMLHFKVQDHDQVTDHYDRGNDFYEAFLGPLMVYTSGIRCREDETLEEMQINKIKEVCKRILMKPGDKHLDIGCGWGTFVNFAAEHYGSKGTGVSISENQIKWAQEKAVKHNTSANTEFLCMDYRDIPHSKYDKITCLEMSEHVGIRLYPRFLKQVYNLLDDNGIFYLQIAGLRRAWKWEDILWGFFMDTYIFPGAEASLPLIFPVGQLESAGFEVHSVETIGVHYSETIREWYRNWIQPETRKNMSLKYGSRLCRIWEIFLAWSTIIARQGNSTCYMIVAHKNRNDYDRLKFSADRKEII